MNSLSVEALKRMNLAEFLARYYGLVFQHRGGTYECCSPFTGERRPSFFVRLVDGHWLFKDYSSGAGGSIFDFVQMKEKLAGFSQAKAFICQLVGVSVIQTSEGKGTAALAEGENAAPAERPYEVAQLYDRFRQEDPSVCRDYLLGRRIAAALVEALIGEGTVVHNRWLKGEQLQRKERAQKVLPEQTVENAAKLIGTFPHFSGRKGQDYMLYHQLGLIGEKAYDGIKRSVRRLLLEEAVRRELFDG